MREELLALAFTSRVSTLLLRAASVARHGDTDECSTILCTELSTDSTSWQANRTAATTRATSRRTGRYAGARSCKEVRRRISTVVICRSSRSYAHVLHCAESSVIVCTALHCPTLSQPIYSRALSGALHLKSALKLVLFSCEYWYTSTQQNTSCLLQRATQRNATHDTTQHVQL